MPITIAKRLGETKEYYFSRKLREIGEINQSGGLQVLNLGIGSPDLPPPAAAIERLRLSSLNPNHHAYQSYKGSPELRQAFAAWYQRSYGVALDANTEILPLIGSKEGIMHITMTFVDAGEGVLVPNPGYPAYRAVTNLAQGIPINYDLEERLNWRPDLDKIAQQDLSNVKIMWVNYPNMPTGADASDAFFQELIAFGKEQDILICNDNPYSFILNNNPTSLLSIEGAKETALELNSLSKSHNMAGWRVGMIGGKAEFINAILRFKSNMDSGQFLPVQQAAAMALAESKDWYAQQNEIYQKRRAYIWQIMDLLDAKYQKEQVGMFVWAKVPDKVEAVEEWMDEVLYNARVFITPGFIFGTNGGRYIRASLCSKIEKLEEALNRIKAWKGK